MVKSPAHWCLARENLRPRNLMQSVQGNDKLKSIWYNSLLDMHLTLWEYYKALRIRTWRCLLFRIIRMRTGEGGTEQDLGGITECKTWHRRLSTHTIRFPKYSTYTVRTEARSCCPNEQESCRLFHHCDDVQRTKESNRGKTPHLLLNSCDTAWTRWI